MTGGKRGILVRMSQPSRHAVCLGPPESFPVVPQAGPPEQGRARPQDGTWREGGKEGSKLLFPFNASWHVASPILRPVSSALTPPIKILQPQSPSVRPHAHVPSVCLPDSWISIRDEGGMHEEVEGTDSGEREQLRGPSSHQHNFVMSVSGVLNLHFVPRAERLLHASVSRFAGAEARPKLPAETVVSSPPLPY